MRRILIGRQASVRFLVLPPDGAELLMRRQQGHSLGLSRQILGLAAGMVFSLLFALSAPPSSQAAAPQSPSSRPSDSALASDSVVVLTMGTLIQAQVFARDSRTASALTDLIQNRALEYNQLFTVHEKSPLTAIAENSGKWTAIDCRAAGLIEQAKTVARDSAGAFDPTIGPVVNVWKIGFGGNAEPPAGQIKAAAALVDWKKIETDLTPGKCRVRIGPGQSLDLGGIAKGWIGTELAKELEKSGAVSAMIDLGGNIALHGLSSKGRDWMIGIQVPEAERGEAFAAVSARGESVITSGDYERFIAADGKVFGHILSAATGRPVPMTMSSVTVVDPDGAKADAWCTAFFAMGLDKTLEYMRTHPQMRVLVLGADKKTVWVSESLAARVTLIDDLKMNVVRAQKPDLSEGKN